MTDFLNRLALAMIMVLCLSVPIGAQVSLSTVTGSAVTGEPAQNDLAAAIAEAAAQGVSVVIIDSAGNLVATQPGPTPETEVNPMEGASMLMRTQSEVSRFRERLRERLDALPNSLAEVAYILRATSPDGRIMTYVEVLLWSMGLFLFSRFVTTEIYGKRIVRNFVVGRIKENPQGYAEKMPFLVFRFIMGVGGTLFSMAVAYGTGALIFGGVDDISVQITIAAIYAGYFAARTVSDLWRMILSPFLSQYRIPKFSDRDAKRLHYWASILAGFSVFVAMFSSWIADFGLNYNVYAILTGLLGLVTLLLNIAMILFNARAISNAIRNGRDKDDVSWLLRTLSLLWAPALIVYFTFGWLKLAFDLVLENPIGIPVIAGAYLVFLSMIVVYGVFNYIIERFYDRKLQVERLNTELAAAEAQ
ncbi:MAG: mechanosensitive ion channel family protein, partial [Sedimentitalea sp.]